MNIFASHGNSIATTRAPRATEIKWHWGQWALIVGAICIGAILRFAIDLEHGLWEDEIIAVTHAVQSFPHFFVQILRNDIHPPLYFLQLHLWGKISHSDIWFKANSALWGTVALLSLWFILREWRSERLAWTAAAMLAILPTGLWMSQEVRPYAWLSTLVIWTHYFSLRSFAHSQKNTQNYLILLLGSLCIIYSHALGFLAVFFLGIFGLILLRGRMASRRELSHWLLLYSLAATASMPVIVSNLLHDANLGDPVSPNDIMSWLSSLITARDARGWSWWAGLAVYLAIVFGGLILAHTRIVTICFLVAPLAVAALVSTGLKPVFKSNFFGAFLAPFIAIVLAELCIGMRPRIQKFAIAFSLALLLAINTAGWANKLASTDFRHAALDIQGRLQPEDVVYAPQLSIFWGMAWYLAGPQWGSALMIANPPTAQWRRVYTFLGPWLVDLLQLMPRTQTVPLHNGARLVVGNDSISQVTEAARRIWLITYQRADLPDDFPPDSLGPFPKSREVRHGSLTVSFYESHETR